MNTKQPNVLFIAVDDLRPQLGCYGLRQMATPHIDALADRGVLFQRAYCQVPVCGATRASLLTGVRPARDRFVHYSTWVDEDLPGALTLPEHFRKNGYHTHACGKVFHHAPDAAERSWTTGPWQPTWKGTWRNYLSPANLELDESPDHAGPPYECIDVPDDAYADGQIASHAIGQLETLSRGDKPFFLATGFVKPHLPFNAPKRYWGLYDCDDAFLADNSYAPQDAPAESLHNWNELRMYFNIPAEGPLSDEMAHRLVHGYYAATSYTDAQVGRLLAKLDALGLRENTIVILWGDHGWQLGEHGLWCKHCNYNTSLNAPLMISAPGLSSGKQAGGLVEFLDVYPTLCDLAGLPSPDHVQGASLTPLLEDPTRDGKDEVFCRYHGGESIRTGRHLYTEWTDIDGNRTARMLYDHERDRDENVNIAERTENAELVNDLSQRLTAARKRFADPPPMTSS